MCPFLNSTDLKNPVKCLQKGSLTINLDNLRHYKFDN